MTPHACTHLDCRNYAPVDVVKGICHRTKNLILGDDAHCEHFMAVAKCKWCRHFAAGLQPFLGTCDASPSRPMVYPDLHAVTCEWFAARP